MAKVAALQMCACDDVDRNLAQAALLIAEASRCSADICVLPEMFSFMGKALGDTVSVGESYMTGKVQRFLSNQAKRHQIWVVGGSIPIQRDGSERVRSACLVYDHTGHEVGRYDKMHLFDVTLSSTESYCESNYIEPGDTKPIVIETPFGKIGLAICFDLRFPEFFIALRHAGAEIIVVPAAFTFATGQAHWSLLLRARAIDTFCYVLGANQFGQHPSGLSTYGHSMAVDPWGQVLAEHTEASPGVVLMDVDLAYLAEIRQRMPAR